VALPTAYVSWSSGKDSAFALYEAGRSGLARIAGVLTTINEVHDRVAMHGVRSALLDRQIVALGLRELPETVDPCGENGEFHTVVTAGPMFSAPIAVAIGETVERDGFVFTDVVPR
jgi:diphthamide synthase (EF-2-diphthine--ammonia ligase)